MDANATDLFDNDSARIHPGGWPASPVNNTTTIERPSLPDRKSLA
jgi:hypothetical protein